MVTTTKGHIVITTRLGDRYTFDLPCKRIPCKDITTHNGAIQALVGVDARFVTFNTMTFNKRHIVSMEVVGVDE